MTTRKYISHLILISILLILTLQVQTRSTGAMAMSNNQHSTSSTRMPSSSPIQAYISIDIYPPIGSPATVTCEISSAVNASLASAQIELPPNTKILNGDLDWEGSLLAGESQVFSAVILFEEPGDKAIFCRAQHVLDSENSYGDLAELYLSIGEDAGQIGYASIEAAGFTELGVPHQLGDGILLDEVNVPTLPASNNQSAEPIPNLTSLPDGDDSRDHNDPSVEAPIGMLTVKGHWAFIDRDNNYTSAIESLVEVVRGDNGKHLDWCYTDHRGLYSCGPFPNPGSAGVRTILHTFTRYNPHGDVLAVVNPHWGANPNNLGNLYRVRTGVTVFSDGTHDIGAWFVTDGSSFERAFWAHNDLLRVWRYIFFQTGINQNPPETAGPATVEWAIDSTDGTYYVRGKNIHLTGADPLSNTVVGHEYGHNIMFTVYGDRMPVTHCPRPHYINLASHINCAWTEGWANFLPLVVNNDPVYRWSSGNSINLENPTWNSIGWDNGDDVEGRVAGALWDIFDSRNEGDDLYTTRNIVAIWDTLYHQNDDNFAEFWAAWKARGHMNGSTDPLMSLLQNTIDYRNGPGNDDFSEAENIGTLPWSGHINTINATTQGLDPNTPCGSSFRPKQSRSVWYQFTPPTSRLYNISTAGSNYDTVVAIWTGPQGALVNRGCDDDNGPGSRSSISVSLNQNTTYYIEVMAKGTGPGGSLKLSVRPTVAKIYLPFVSKP
jgi:hypothetical protein